MEHKDDIVGSAVPNIDVPTERIEAFCRKWKIKELSLFGSVLRDDFGPDSDVDVLVEFEPDPPWGLYEIVDMQDELTEMFAHEVHIAMKPGLKNPFRRHEILRSRRVVYAA